MRSRYERLGGLDEALDRIQKLSVQTVIFDVEPLTAVPVRDQGLDVEDDRLH